MNWLERANEAGVDGFMHPVELEKLVELATGKNVLEIGSYKGLSAWCMAHTARTLTCVDTFRAATNGQRQEDHLTTYADFISAVGRFGNISVYVGTSEEAAQRVVNPQEMIFLDAMHTYEDVKADIERWWPHLLPGGLMVFHDYGHDDYPGVKQAVEERFGPLPQVITLAWVEKPE